MNREQRRQARRERKARSTSISPDLHFIQIRVNSIVLAMQMGDVGLAQRTTDLLIKRYPKMSGNIRLAITDQYASWLEQSKGQEPDGSPPIPSP